MKKLLISLLVISSILFSTEIVAAKTTLDCTKYLKKGSKSEQVRILQQELNKVMKCNLKVDGDFGPATKSCVLSFQKNYSLQQDAIVGPKTCTKLNDLYSSEEKENVSENTSSNLLTSTKILAQGSKGDEVKILQQLLNEKLHCNIDETGTFEFKTNWCVKKYQEENNLKVDGSVGDATKESLNKLALKKDNSKYVSIAKTSSNRLRVRQGTSTSTKHIGYVYTSEIYKIHSSKVVDGTTWYFILLDISDQTLKLYKNGQVILMAPTITGNKSRGHDTPLGAYSIGTPLSSKTWGKKIHLSKYDAYVDYWMPFIGGSYGFHDADWKTISQITNKKTYLTNGSHGCVNMLKSDAKYLYDNIYKGLAVHIVE